MGERDIASKVMCEEPSGTTGDVGFGLANAGTPEAGAGSASLAAGAGAAGAAAATPRARPASVAAEHSVVRPSLEQALAYAAEEGYQRVPVACDILSDTVTPITVMRKLKRVSDHCYLLESAADSAGWGRYSFLGYDPILEITCQNGHMKVGTSEFEVKHPAPHLRQILREYRTPKVPGLPSFTGGLVGYFSYDYLKYAEPTLRLDAQDTEGFKDMDLMLFDKVIAFDNFKQKITLVVNADLSDGEVGYRRAVKQLEQMAQLVLEGEEACELPGRLKSAVKPLFDQVKYCDMVRRAQRYIHEGDIFQVVLSNRLEAEFEGSLLNTYRILRTLNPSPYLFYFASSDMEVAGASPETLVKLEDGVLHTFPLAGTRPRGATPQEDAALEAELLADEKELAEHNMLVDLGRNDLGKIARFGSVQVEDYLAVQHYSHVMHIGSTVRAEIDAARDAVDAVDAILPAGTLSGAPKIRACQLINDLEDSKRGIYGGAIGYLDFTGNMDVCIAIRLAFKKNGKVFVRSGAGIVADSVPEREYEECLNKAAAVLAALHEAEDLR